MEQEAVESSCVRVREATRDVAILKAKLRAIEGWRDHEILTLRTAGKDAVDSLKVCHAVGVLRYRCISVAISYHAQKTSEPLVMRLSSTMTTRKHGADCSSRLEVLIQPPCRGASMCLSVARTT